MPQVALIPHSASPSSIVRSIRVQANAEPQGMLDLRYVLEGDIGRIRLPPIRESRRADELWQHTCFELFVRADESTAYREYNFAPSTQWAAYDFIRYREGMTPAQAEHAPTIALRRSDYRLELHTALPVAASARLALAAVIEEEGGKLSYWALAHPSGKPDFHHPHGFTLKL